MYSILGVASSNQARERFAHACDWIAGTERGPVTRQQPESNQIFWGTTGEGGTVLGVAHHGGSSLAYIGAFHHPFPGWDDGSPLDNPNRTASVLLHRFLDQGPSFLNGLYGHYVVIIVQKDRRSVFVASDPLGGRRAFVKNSGDGLFFSTSLVDLQALRCTNTNLERLYEDFLLSYEFLPDNRTLYEGVEILEAGTLLEWCNGVVKKLPIKKPSWSKDVTGFAGNEEAAIEVLYNRFMLSVEAISPTGRNVAVLLGGFDSALVAAALRRLGKDVETFTFRFRDYPYNQKHTGLLSKFINSSHTHVDINPNQIREGIENYEYRFNQPSSQAHYPIQTLEALRHMRRHGHSWCFTGDGCDEMFLGYPMVHRRARLFEKLGVLPATLTKIARTILGNPMVEDRCGHPCRVARNVLTVLSRRMPARGYVANRIFDDISLKRLRGGVKTTENQLEMMLSRLAESFCDLDVVRLAYKGKAVVGINRNRNEGATAFSGISMQSPFQHAAVTEFAAQIPPSMLRPASINGPDKNLGKYILLKMAEQKGLLPPEIIYQAKASPVTAPVDYWYSSELRNTLFEKIKRLPFDYDSSYVEQLLAHKKAEEYFRNHGGIGRYTSHLVSMLFTYASFN